MNNHWARYIGGDSWWWLPCIIIIISQIQMVRHRDSNYMILLLIGWQITFLFCTHLFIQEFSTNSWDPEWGWLERNSIKMAQEFSATLLRSVFLSTPTIFLFSTLKSDSILPLRHTLLLVGITLVFIDILLLSMGAKIVLDGRH